MSFEKEYLSLEEVADLLGVNYQLIYKLVRSGELTAVRIGRVYRVTRRDLDEYLHRSKTVGAAGIACSSCGKAYFSKSSVPQSCTVCESPICVDCWNRKGIRFCREHEAAAKKTKPGKQEE